ncbi:MAG TPA: trypsin-like peptidase domain-containing protein [Candidatus Paceibacterota bacterium]|nr:trypsin-like peptidase domain-containing protein [Candidatus Paceibacterota bacterium]HSA00627.1 trypsin-like peptidase domain-containing protein [Candidatus Paceibacterota bacterium]
MDNNPADIAFRRNGWRRGNPPSQSPGIFHGGAAETGRRCRRRPHRAGYWLAVWATTLGMTVRLSASTEPDIRRDAAVTAIERVMPSVVNIVTKTRVERRGYFFDWWRDNWSPFVQQLPPQTSAGSGVIIDANGYILTNVHVVEGADEIWIKLMDNSPPLRAVPVAGARNTDVALLRIQGEPGRRYQAVKFARDDDLLLGETVLALGNPFGLGGSVSRGILSAKSRRATASSEDALEIPDWLQTDAAINPGNSGGPLINLRGELIGINVAVFRQGQGIGFAIPVKQVSEALSSIFTPESLSDLWWGARVRAGEDGFEIVEVQAGSPAEKGDLRCGDRILSVNGQVPESLFGLMGMVAESGGRGPVRFGIRRDRESMAREIGLIPKKTVFNAALVRQKLGLALQPMTAEQAGQLGLDLAEGFVIVTVDRNSGGARAGLAAGQVVLAVDGQSPGDITALAEFLYGKQRGDPVRLTVLAPQRRGPLVQVRRVSITVVVS